MREAKALRKSQRLRGLPKSRFKRILWRMNPRRQAEYWFSRDGAIMALKAAGIAILVLFIFTLGVFAYFRKDLPDISVNGQSLGGSISYYDRTGKTLLWEDYNAVKRVPVESNQISPYMKDATIATEDRNFYNERGFDVKGIVRAAVNDVFHRGSTQGGSTITQQLVKLNLDWTDQRTITRKVKELILAVELERSYTKDEILTAYLNAAPYGGVDYGVQTAASDYFHKSAKDLTLPEAAMLAAIPKSPSVYSPYNKELFNKQLFLSRYDYVLDSMVQTHYITKAQAQAAKKTDVLAEVQPQQTKYAGIQAPYFVLSAKDELQQRFINCSSSNTSGCNKIGGWKVTTTVNMDLQSEAESVVQKNLPNLERYGGDEEALVAEDVKTGQVLAAVGGTDFTNPDHGQLNFAHSVNVSPGSSFKPYDYTTFINNNNNVGAGSVLYDSKGPIPGYPCTTGSGPTGNCAHDYDFNYPGPETLRYALGGSRNVPAIKAMVEALPNDTSTNRTASINKTIQTADALMDTPDAYRCYKPGTDVSEAKPSEETQCYSSSAIGDGAYIHLDNHVNGLASLARLGYAIPQTYILSIKDASGKTFYQFKQPKGKQVVRQDAAYIVDNMLSDPNASYLVGGEKWHHYKGWDTAVKTGTTNDSFDGLMMGWNTQFAVGAWVGYHTRNKALTTFMENLTLPLTKNFMEYALDSLHTTPVNWTEPSGIQHLPAYVMHSKISRNGEIVPSPSTDIYPSWYKQSPVSSQSITIDKVSGKVATSCTPAMAKQTEGGNAAPNAFSVDDFYPPGNNASTQTANAASSLGTDSVHSCSDQAPTITLTVNGSDGNSSTASGSATCNGTCQFVATVSAGTHPLYDSQYASAGGGYVEFLVNGQSVNKVSLGAADASSTTKSYTYTPPSGTGTATISAQVVDSVLYQGASSSVTISYTSTTQGGQTGGGNGGGQTGGGGGGTGINYPFPDCKPGHHRICPGDFGFLDSFFKNKLLLLF